MSNPTSNFNWQMPTSTDLVTDLPADFEVFGQAVDTSLADLKGGTTGQVLSKASNTDMDFTWVAQDDSNAIQNAIVDAKGDLISATAADTPARLAVGANGTYLKANSSTATGLEWGTVSAGGWTQLASGTLSGSSVSLTSISQDYRNLHLVITGAYRTSSGSYILVRINSNTNNQYYSTWTGSSTAVGIGSVTNFWRFVNPTDSSTDINSTANEYSRIWTFYDYTASARRIVGSYGSEPVSGYNMNNMHRLDDTAAVSSIQLSIPSGSFGGGSYILYGEK
jgi:hypothetical protein